MQDAELKAVQDTEGWDRLNQMGYYGNIFVRVHLMPEKGMVHGGHNHNFDHVTIVASGSLRVKWKRWKDNNPNDELLAYGQKDFKAPTFFIVDKDTFHEIEALEDDTAWFCTYAVPNGVAGAAGDFAQEANNPYV